MWVLSLQGQGDTYTFISTASVRIDPGTTFITGVQDGTSSVSWCNAALHSVTDVSDSSSHTLQARLAGVDHILYVLWTTVCIVKVAIQITLWQVHSLGGGRIREVGGLIAWVIPCFEPYNPGYWSWQVYNSIIIYQWSQRVWLVLFTVYIHCYH